MKILLLLFVLSGCSVSPQTLARWDAYSKEHANDVLYYPAPQPQVVAIPVEVPAARQYPTYPQPQIGGGTRNHSTCWHLGAAIQCDRW